MRPNDFFQRVLPTRIVDRLQDFLAAEGTLGIDITGGPRWVIAFGDMDHPVRRARGSEVCTLDVRMSPDVFDAFTEGTLDVPFAVRTGALTAAGDVNLLWTLSRLLETAVSPLAARLGRF